MKKLTLLEAAKEALSVAEGHIKSDYEGTSMMDGMLEGLEPIREAIREAENSCSQTAHDDIYYKVYKTEDNKVVTVCMQWFDEADYDNNRFISDEKFKTEADAEYYIKLYNSNLLVLESLLNRKD